MEEMLESLKGECYNSMLFNAMQRSLMIMWEKFTKSSRVSKISSVKESGFYCTFIQEYSQELQESYPVSFLFTLHPDASEKDSKS